MNLPLRGFQKTIMEEFVVVGRGGPGGLARYI